MSITFAGETHEAIVAGFEWNLPERFNIATACCDAPAARDPGRIALRQWNGSAPGPETSFGELKSLSDALAHGFGGLGARAGDRVAIILPQSLETVVTHLAIYKQGMIAVPLARLFAADALQYRLHRAGVRFLVTNREGAEKIAVIRDQLPDLEAVIVTGSELHAGETGFASLTADRRPFETADTGPDTPALIIFTSGTTGPPKGALHGHKVLIGHLPGLKTHHEFMPQPGDMAWTPADWAWAGGLLNILLPCLMMEVPVVYGGLDRFEAEAAFALMEAMGVANAFIPPTALRLMRQVEAPAARFDLGRLRTIGTGGESLGAETHQWAERELGIRINEFYGQTECNLVLSCFGAVGVMKAGSIGKPVPGHKVAVIDEQGVPCAPGIRGEVAVARPDPVMFLEYWQDDEATERKFRGDWMLTGDQAVVDGEGYFTFVGRDDDIINVSGYRVGPGEIEDCLISHPAVQLAAAVGKPDALKGEIVKAYVVVARGHEPGEALAADIRKHVKARLAANIYPREIEFVDAVPLTTTGKVIRREFRERARREASAG